MYIWPCLCLQSSWVKFFLPKTAWAYIVNCCIMRIVTITNFNYFTPKKSIYVELYWNVKYIQYHNSITFAFWPNHRYSKTFYLDVVARCIIDLWYPTFVDDSNSRLRSRAGKSKEKRTIYKFLTFATNSKSIGNHWSSISKPASSKKNSGQIKHMVIQSYIYIYIYIYICKYKS